MGSLSLNEKAVHWVFSENGDQILPVIEDGLEMQSFCSQATILSFSPPLSIYRAPSMDQDLGNI